MDRNLEMSGWVAPFGSIGSASPPLHFPSSERIMVKPVIAFSTRRRARISLAGRVFNLRRD
jgi:hypothetical protein